MNETPSNAPEDADPFLSEIQSREVSTKLKRLVARARILFDDREDIVSDIISAAIRNRSGYDPHRASVTTWVLAIGKKVIATYFRKRQAQKRAPSGGVVSLDISGRENDQNGNEPADAAGQTKHEVSEQVQHYVDCAKLSEKEAEAIGLRLDRKSQNGDKKFSRSTAQRALKKLKQIASDDKFRQRPQGPDAVECAYGTIPVGEGDAAILFDQLRRTPWFVHSTTQWRESSQWSDAQACLQSERDLKKFPLRIPVQHWSEELRKYREAAYNRSNLLYRRFEAAVEITLAFPEWPMTGYCQLGPKDRRNRLREFGWTFRVEPFWEITEPTFEVFVQAADEPSEPIKTLDQFLEFLNKSPTTGSHLYSSTHLIRIDWRYPAKTLMASFKRWAENARKRDAGRIDQAGRPVTINLVGFAGVRLIDDYGLSLNQAMSWLRDRYGGAMPKTPERLERAIKEVREKLRDFLPSPAEIGV